MQSSALVARRLRAQQIGRPLFADPAGVVASMGAVQAQDYAAAKWAVALRVRGEATEDTVEHAIATGAAIRIHAMRWTWQLIAPSDVRWILELVRPRLLA